MSADDEPVPKLPRGRGFKLSRGALMRIAMTAILLVTVIVIARPCGDTVSKFVNGFGSGEGSGSGQMPKPGSVDDPTQKFERITPDMSEAELRAVIERAKARNNQGSASAGSATAGSGSAPASGGASASGSGSASAPATSSGSASAPATSSGSAK